MVDVQSVELTLLNTDEIVELDRLETTIQHGLETFMEVGSALAEINEKKLWRQTHTSFVDYARERWGMGKTYAYNLVAGAEVAGRISSIEEFPQPQNESQVRPLRQLAPERQPEAWQRAVATAPNGEVTAEHVKSVVDEMLGKKGRFENNEYYPVYDAGKLIFNAPGKVSDVYNDKRFQGVCQPIHGKQLNAAKNYEAYSLVDVPEVHVQTLESVFPKFRINSQYPVDRANRVIFDAPVEGYARPINTYNGCEWLTGYEIKRQWELVVGALGGFQVAPAREISTEWLKTSAFQPGMQARCPRCDQGWQKQAALQPYEAWTPLEPGYWRCERGDRIEDAKLLIEMVQPTLPGTPAAPALDDEDEPDEGPDTDGEETEDIGPTQGELEEVLDAIMVLDELIELIHEKPNLVRLALDQDTVEDYRKRPYVPKGRLTDDAIAIVQKWLDAGE